MGLYCKFTVCRLHLLYMYRQSCLHTQSCGCINVHFHSDQLLFVNVACCICLLVLTLFFGDNWDRFLLARYLSYRLSSNVRLLVICLYFWLFVNFFTCWYILFAPLPYSVISWFICFYLKVTDVFWMCNMQTVSFQQ